jgi:hypothetical protein
VKSRAKYLIISVGLLFLSGCAAKTHYVWSDYDTKLYKYYQNPSERDEFVLQLKEVLDECESAGRVPPGIYAEYGYMMYEQGNSLQAVAYYQKEADKWPESKAFMSKMITNAQKRSKKQDIKANPAVQVVVPTPEEKLIETTPEVTK